MAAIPSSPRTWTRLTSTNPSVGPDISWAATSNGTLYMAPSVAGSLIFVASGAEPAGTTITWTELVATPTTAAPSIAFASIGATAALYFGAGSLTYAAGA